MAQIELAQVREYTPEPTAPGSGMGTLVESDFDRGLAIWLFHDSYAGYPRTDLDNYGDDDVTAWIDGEVYGWILSTYDGSETIDSCWGFYGFEWAKTCAIEAFQEGGY